MNIFWCFKFKTKRKYIVDSLKNEGEYVGVKVGGAYVVNWFITYTFPLRFARYDAVNGGHTLAVHFSLTVEVHDV